MSGVLDCCVKFEVESLLKVLAVDGDVYDEGVLYLLKDSEGLGSRDGRR